MITSLLSSTKSGRQTAAQLGPSGANSTIAASVGTIANDGVASSTISVTVMAVDNSPLSGVTVTLAATGSGNTITQPVSTTNSAGVATGSMVTTGATAHTVSATANGIAVTATTTVTGQAANAPDTHSTLALSANTEAVGAAVTATVQAKDSSNVNIVVGGATVVITASGGTAVVNIGSVADNGNGTYTASISGLTAGTATTIAATINGSACTASGTVTLTVTAGSGVTGDLYEWGFEGASDAIASGALVNSGTQSFLANTAWDRDTTAGTFYRGVQAVKQIYTPGGVGVNRGDAFFYKLAAARTATYVRFAYMQSSPFNDSGGNSNSDGVKMLRFFGPGIAGPYGGLGIRNTAGTHPPYIVTFDNLNGSLLYTPNTNLPAPDPNSKLGVYQVFEVFHDITTSGALRLKVWIDDVLYFDITDTSSNQSKTIQWIQFDGTINSVATSCTAWIDSVGVGTTKMGIPA